MQGFRDLNLSSYGSASDKAKLSQLYRMDCPLHKFENYAEIWFLYLLFIPIFVCILANLHHERSCRIPKCDQLVICGSWLDWLTSCYHRINLILIILKQTSKCRKLPNFLWGFMNVYRNGHHMKVYIAIYVYHVCELWLMTMNTINQ